MLYYAIHWLLGCHPEDGDTPKSEYDMMLSIFAYIDRCAGTARSLFLSHSLSLALSLSLSLSRAVSLFLALARARSLSLCFSLSLSLCFSLSLSLSLPPACAPFSLHSRSILCGPVCMPGGAVYGRASMAVRQGTHHRRNTWLPWLLTCLVLSRPLSSSLDHRPLPMATHCCPGSLRSCAPASWCTWRSTAQVPYLWPTFPCLSSSNNNAVCIVIIALI